MQGIDPRTVQKWMGHKDLATTLRYAHVSAHHEKLAKEFAYIRLTCFLFYNQVDSTKGKDQTSPPNAPNSAIVGISSRSPLPPKTGPSTGMKKVKQAMQCKAVPEKMG